LSSSLSGVKVAVFAYTVTYTVKICVIFGVRFEKRKVYKKQTYMKTETCKLYYRDFYWIFLSNTIKIDPCNFELYHFRVGQLFETQCSGGSINCRDRTLIYIGNITTLKNRDSTRKQSFTTFWGIYGWNSKQYNFELNWRHVLHFVLKTNSKFT